VLPSVKTLHIAFPAVLAAQAKDFVFVKKIYYLSKERLSDKNVLLPIV